MRVISISGGRSSAMMLKIMVDDGLLPGDVVCFANTGREDEATLRFVQKCSEQWEVPVVWLEYRATSPKFEVVDFTSASRKDNPRPFNELLDTLKYLPNPVKRICTAEMKIKTIRRYVRSLGHRGDIPTFVGLRYDEPTRVARKKAQNAAGKEPEICFMPLYDFRVTVRERDEFWRQQGFDLSISSHSDNCDFCFLKGKMQQIWRIRENPEAVDWWIERERLVTQTSGRCKSSQFRKEYSFAELKHIALSQATLDFPEQPTQSLTCSCTD